MTFLELGEFKKDLKTLSKKYRTIPYDLEVVKKVLEVLPDERPPFIFRIDHLGIKTSVIKIKKMACQAQRQRRPFRIAIDLCTFSKGTQNHIR